jgi:hypothetical protein
VAGIVTALKVVGFRQESLRQPQTEYRELDEDIVARIAAQADRNGFTELACRLRELATRVGRLPSSTVGDRSRLKISSPPVPTINAA